MTTIDCYDEGGDGTDISYESTDDQIDVKGRPATTLPVGRWHRPYVELERGRPSLWFVERPPSDFLPDYEPPLRRSLSMTVLKHAR